VAAGSQPGLLRQLRSFKYLQQGGGARPSYYRRRLHTSLKGMAMESL